MQYPPFIAVDDSKHAICNRCPDGDKALYRESQIPAHLADPDRRRWHGAWEKPTQGELDTRAILTKITDKHTSIVGPATEALVDAFRPYVESSAPFEGSQVADQLGSVVGEVEWDQEETCGWWAFHAPESGPFIGALVVLEWDYTGWRWGYTFRPDVDIDVVIPLTGYGLSVVADLLAILTEPLPAAADGLAEVATEDGNVTTGDRSAMNRFVGRAALLLADPAMRNTL